MYNKVLTGILVILIIAIMATLGYLGYNYYKKYTLNNDAEEFLQEFDTIVVPLAEQQPELQPEPDSESEQQQPETSQKPVNSTKPSNYSADGLTYKGFKVVGKLEMPTINIRYPILGESEKAKSLEVSIVKIYGPEINAPGNVVIAGHNYNNGLFFGKNKNLKVGDKIYITDMQGNRVEYTIYNKYYTPEGDYSYMTRNTEGKTEVTLYTCDATGANRLIVCARAD